MGNSLIIVPRNGNSRECEDLLTRGKSVIDCYSSGHTVSSISTNWSLAALYPRISKAGQPITIDKDTGCWLIALGTWFHQSRNGRNDYLLKRYLAAGAAVLACELDGFFVVVIGDAGRREVVVITDIVGSLHFYCRQLPQGMALSTSSLLLSRLAAVTLDPVGCQEFLGTGIMYEDRTFYNEVRKLPPASITTFFNGQQSTQEQYWNPTSLVPESLPAEPASDVLWAAMGSAVTSISGRYQSVACDLTGGYDSRAVAAAFLSSGTQFTAVVSGPHESGDVNISTRLAAKFGLNHLHYPYAHAPITPAELELVGALTDGECDITEYVNVARIHRDLSRRFEISINGSFGEIARGYWWELLFPHIGTSKTLDAGKLARQRYAVEHHPALLQLRYDFDLAEHLEKVIGRTTAGLEQYPNTFKMDITYLRMRMQRWQGRLASSTNRIWPCLSLFMLRPVLETMLQAKCAARKRSFLIRLMLAKYQPPWAGYPLEHGYPALPATWRTIPRFGPLVPYYTGRVIQKLKGRFVKDARDISENTRLDLWQMEEVREVLRPAAMRSMEILDSDQVIHLLKASQLPMFSQGRLWSRLLSLEWAISRDRVTA